MVSYKDIQASNVLINDTTAPRVAVFVGGTSGIGKFTVRALALTGASIRVYLVGRKSSEERTQAFIQELRSINPKAEFIWTEGEVALLVEAKRVCEAIKAKESRVDLLFLTTGYTPFNGRKETSEGVEITQSLEYYTRLLFILHLLPLLNEAEAPRVVSVLTGGLGLGTIDLDDLDLKKPGSFSARKARPLHGIMNTAGLEKLASDNPNVTFIHSCPGSVDTGNVWRGADPNSIMAWVIWLVIQPLIRIFSFSDEESGQRHLFQSTSAAFGGRGVPWKGKPGLNTLGKPAENGLFLVNHKCNCTPNANSMSWIRGKALQRIWEHTQEILQPYL